MSTVIQRNFSGGEISPSLYSRVDYYKYQNGLRSLRNAYVMRHGGARIRPGTSFIEELRDPSRVCRLFPYSYGDNDYCLVFNDDHVRFIKDGSYVRLSAQSITGITQANPAVVTVTAHGYSNNDAVYIYGVSGMTEINGRNYEISNVTANTFEISYGDGTAVDSTGFTAYSSGGSSEKIYEISQATYDDTEIGELNFTQSDNSLIFVHEDFEPLLLTRTSDSSWAFSILDVEPSISGPTGISASVGSAGNVNYRYIVTAIKEDTFEESYPGTSTSISISVLTNANPVKFQVTSHGLVAGDVFRVNWAKTNILINNGVVPLVRAVAQPYEVSNVVDANGFNIALNTSSASTFDSPTASSIYQDYAAANSSAVPTAASPNTISWSAVTGATEYNVYRADDGGRYGLIGITSNTSLNDIGATADTTITPPRRNEYFLSDQNYPRAVAYIQQRLALGGTNTDPEKLWLSQIGNFSNFTRHQPIQDDDAIIFNIVGREYNGIRHIVDLDRLIVFTDSGEYVAVGGNGEALTPSSVNLKKTSYNGTSSIAPIVSDNVCLYIQKGNKIVRDLIYDFNVDGLKGNDLTVFSNHLFKDNTIVDWSYEKRPESIAWAVRDDGVILGITYVPGEQVIGWHRHDLKSAIVENVVCVDEGANYGTYLCVKRTINGSTARYIEKMNPYEFTSVTDVKIMDSVLSYDGTNSSATTMTLSGGTNWTFDEVLTLTASASYFASTDVGNAIHLTGSDGTVIRCTITAYTSATVVSITPNKTVPASMRSTAISTWSKAVDQVSGLWHLEGETVSVFADGFVVGSPNNASYVPYVVTNGAITLDKPYSVIHVGLPFISDIETLSIDVVNGETLSNKHKLINEVSISTEETRGIFVGSKPPSDDSVDPLEGLQELKVRNDEAYDSPVSLRSDVTDIVIKSEWNNNGRVFIRQVDPVPMSILAIAPSGSIPFK